MKKILILSAAALLTFACMEQTPQKSGQELFYEKCTGCHGTEISLNLNADKSRWDSIVDRMKRHGADVSSAEKKLIVEFLTGNDKG